MSLRGDVDIVVYKNSIKYKDNKERLDDFQKEEVLYSLIEYLPSKENLRVEQM